MIVIPKVAVGNCFPLHSFQRQNPHYHLPKVTSCAQHILSNRRITTAVSGPHLIEPLLAAAKSSFLRYESLDLNEKAAYLVDAGISCHLGHKHSPYESLEERWNRFRLSENGNLSSLPSYSPSDPLENFEAFFIKNNRRLLKEGAFLERYSPKDYIRTPTELLWMSQLPSIPFTKDGPAQKHSAIPNLKDKPVLEIAANTTEEDAVGAWALATQYIDETTVVYEHGCWNGTNLLGLLLYAHENHKHPGLCIGSDINFSALNVAEALSSSFGLSSSFIQFYLSNALDHQSLDFETLKCRKQLLLALRLIPVLEPEDAWRFMTVIKDTMTPKCTLIVSYSLRKGEKYEKNLANAASPTNPIIEVPFDYGTLFRVPFQQPEILPGLIKSSIVTTQVVNCYYSPEGFEAFIDHCGLKIVDSLIVGEYSDNYRAVAALRLR